MPRPRLTGPVSAPGDGGGPADAFGADPPFLTTHRAWVDPVAQRERIEPELLRQFVDRLFHAEGAGRIAGSAHRAARAGVDEHVVLRRLEIRARVDRLGEIADAGAEAHAGRAAALQGNPGQGPVAPGADADALERRGAVARVELLLSRS